jgi:amino acid adenylation domain-containing protein/non-ribosomal peptide synthase protein (TIGR01720 family)
MNRYTHGPLLEPSSVGAILRTRASEYPDRPLYTFQSGDDGERTTLTYGDLDRLVRSLAARLQQEGLAGRRALLLYPPGLEFVAAFLACLDAGVVAVPANPPRINRPMGRLRAIASDATPGAVLTIAALIPESPRWVEQVPELAGLPCLATDLAGDLEDHADSWRDPGTGPETLAFLQYTSGSTAAAKGVMVTHGNLLHNSALIQHAFGSTPASRGVFWLPLVHDMGLIGGVLQTLYCGGCSTLLSPVAFLQRPIRWLQAISETGATISGGPNFAYDLCARKVTEQQKGTLDLSTWTVAFNGAEPIRPETLERFAEAFAPCGFRREAFLPCYGLAEATLMVSAGPPVVVSLAGSALDRNQVVRAVESEPAARRIVGSGRVPDDQTVAIVDPETGTRLPAGRIGEIWVAGPSVALGYWNSPKTTDETFRARLAGTSDGPFLRTGDLGFLQDDALFVTGRLKDLIIICGRNIYPQDIEWTAESAHPALRSGGGAAFGVEIADEERLMIVHEAERVKAAEAETIIRAIQQAIAAEHELDVHTVCLIKPLSLPKTSSGKVQRRACRERFLAGTLEVIATSAPEAVVESPEHAASDPPARHDASSIARWLAERIGRQVGLASERVDLRAPFASFGLGSVQAVSLAGELQDWLGHPLSPTLVYEYPSIETLAQHLAGASLTASEVTPTTPRDEVREGIAIIGIGCRFPGAEGPEAFWELLEKGEDAVGAVPEGRWPPDDSSPRFGGFLSQVDGFDADFFGIAPREAVAMDPQHRLLLEVSWEALEDAGQVPERLAATPVGIFLGIATNDYGRLAIDRNGSSPDYLLTGNAASIAANRLSYLFDFRGPSLAIDTACSSSLVAVHLACQSLRRGESTLALAGGVNLILAPEIAACFKKAGFLAPDGRCKAFDARADGYVRGEGIGVVVLKPLARARADGDPIYAVIGGSAVSQDGRSNGLTAPSREAQEAVLRAAYRDAEIDPGEVQYVEAHGTGTFLGDPIEAKALGAVLGAGRGAESTCLIGSVKTNIGHLEAAAGVAGLIKVALALHHRQVPPSLHFQTPNPHVPFEALSLRVATAPVPWPGAASRALAGVSSFGFGGTNAHVVVEGVAATVGAGNDRIGQGPTPVCKDGVSQEINSSRERLALIPLSARTPDALRALAGSVRDELARTLVPLDDLAYSATVRRGHHEHRLALLAATPEEVLAQLDAYLRGESSPGLLVGRKPSGAPAKDRFVAAETDAGADRQAVLRETASAYVRGEPVDWSRLYPSGRFVKLPSYPWRRERFWLEGIESNGDVRQEVDGSNGHSPPGTNGNGHHVPSSAYRSAQRSVHGNGKNGSAVAEEEVGTRANRLAGASTATHADDVFELQWLPVPRHGSPGASQAGPWLIVADRQGLASRLATAMEARDAACVVLEPLEGVDDRFHETLRTNAFRGVIHLRSLDTPAGIAITLSDLDAAQERGLGEVMGLFQALAGSGLATPPRLWLVTRGAQATGTETKAPAVAQAPLWGLGRSIALERPDLWGGLIDLDPSEAETEVDALADELLGPDGEDQLAYRDGRRMAARLVRRAPLEPQSRGLAIRPEGTYLVTGGLGAIGLQSAHWLVERGARRLVLVGRRGLPDRSSWDDLPATGQVEAVKALERLGATVVIAPVDLADPEAMAVLLEDLRQTFPPIRGVLHAAGTITPQALHELDRDSLWSVLRPKVAGTFVLHEATRNLPLDFFVLFSSVASVLGAREAHYAAANQFLDAFAHARQAIGLPALSVNWGPWAGKGMADAPDRSRAFRLLGLSSLRPDAAFEALDRLAGQETCQAMVAEVDWFTLKSLYGLDGHRRLLEAIEAERSDDRVSSGHRPDLQGTPDERRMRLLAYLRDQVADILRLAPERIETDRPLNTLGLDSLMAIELKSAVESELEATLPLSVLLRGPTLEELVDEAMARRLEPIETPDIAFSTNGSSEPVAEHALSIGQRSLWSLHQLDPTSAAYHVTGAARLRQTIDVDALHRSFQRLVDRHESLRTTFAERDGSPLHRVHRRSAVSFHVEDVSAASEADRSRRLTEEASQPFDLERGPLFRAHLFRRADQEFDLLVSVHHIVSDFWSMAILMDELGQIYPAERNGREPRLAPIERPYSEYVRWQSELLEGPEGTRLWDYWQSQLAGPLPVLSLPTDRARRSLPAHRGASQTLQLDPLLSGRLLRLADEQGASPYVTLLAAFHILLSRYAGQDDVIVGSPVAGRTGPSLAGVVGYFVNPLPIRVRFGGNPTFLEVLRQVRQTVLDGLEHQDFPFAMMVDRLAIERDPSQSPVFQVMFVYQKSQRPGMEGLTSFPLRESRPAMTLGGFSLEPLPLEQPAAQFDLTLMAAEAEGQLTFSLGYKLDLFEPETIDRLLANFRTLLAGIAARPEAPIAALPILSEAERSRVLIEWNAARTDPDFDRRVGSTIQELFEAQAGRTPEALAVAFADTRLTYRELDRRANQLAHFLRARGVGPEIRVGLALDRSAELLVGVLGILKAGGAYVPLDPDYPAERLEFMIADAGVGVLLTREALRARLPETGAPVIALDTEAGAIARESESRPETEVTPENLAYIIYTSGSTGQPKGVMVTQRNLVHSTRARFLAYEEPVGTYLLVSSFAFDSSVAGLFWSLCTGGMLVIPTPDAATDPQRLARLVAEHQVSHVLCVPSLYGLVLDEVPADQLESLRVAIVAGEPCTRAVVESHVAKLPQSALYNEYGPTEATVWCSVHRCRAVEPRASVPIGRPIANTRIYVLDSGMEPVPIGVTGELYVGGEGLARGYWGRPGLTAAQFFPDPFGTAPGRRLYRTGDLARWCSDGVIEFLGRADSQVKIRGFRIELAEIESALARHPGVRQAVVVAREETPGSPSLAAYIVPVETPAPEAADLRLWLRQTLPGYMVPSAFALLQALPLSPNGKVDRKALPVPIFDRARDEHGLVAPRNPVERVLAETTARVLGREAVSVLDNFFDLGVDSIVGIQIVSRARQAGLHLTPSQLFEFPTIAELAVVAGTASTARAEQGRVVGPVPLTPIQRWFFEQGQREPHHFNQAVLLEVNPVPNPAHLSEAVRLLIEHHDALRLRFTREETGWSQAHAEDSGPVPFERVDLSAFAGSEQSQAIASESARTQGSLDLSRGPILRVVLFDLGAGRPGRLLLVVHHLAVDGVSWRILLEDLVHLLRHIERGELPALPPKTTSFRRWSEALMDFAASGALDRERSYWLGTDVAGHPRPPDHVSLPVDLGRDPGTVAQAATVSVALDAEATRGLVQEVPRLQNARIDDVLLSALARTLAAWSGSGTVLVDVEAHGREEIVEGLDLSRTVGWFTTIFPVHLAVDPSDGPVEALRSVQEALANVPRRGIGHGLLRYINRDRDLAGRRGAEVRFNYLGQFDGTLPAKAGFALAGESAGPIQSPTTRRGHLLEIDGRVVEGKLRFDWTFGTTIHRRETIEALAARFLDALRALLAPVSPPHEPGADDRAIEDVYPLSPVQEGILFHTLMAPESGVYVQQFTCRLRGALDVEAFAAAWRSVLARHPVLRTSFRSNDANRPAQVVYRHVPLPFEQDDWRGLNPVQQAERLKRYLAADRVEGFNLSEAPLLRLALLRREDDAYQLVWTYSHLVMDGWCLPIVLSEVLAFYRGESHLGPCRPFRDYIDWLQEQDLRAAEPFWRAALHGFDAATPLGVDRVASAEPASFGEVRGSLPAPATYALVELARANRLTLSTLVQGAWALILSRYSGRSDIVFGSTVSGRPAALEGVETMVGMFINTLPVRVAVRETDPLVPWLRGLQAHLVAVREFEHSPLVKVQGWSNVPRGQPLFESLLIFENYPLDASLASQSGRLTVDEVEALEQTSYPLTIMVIPGAELRFRVGYDTRRFVEETIVRLLGHIRNVLEAFSTDPECRLADIPVMSRTEQEELLRGGNGGPPGTDTVLAELDQLSNAELDELLDRYLAAEGTAHE